MSLAPTGTDASVNVPRQRSATEGDPVPASPRPERFGVRAAWPAVALYAGLRLVCLAVAWAYAASSGKDLWALLGKYDAIWYAGIVERGYDAAIPLRPDGGLATTNLAFFPLFPGLTAALDPIVPGGAGSAGIVASWLAGLAAAWGLFAVGAHVRDRRTGILLAGVWAVLPHAFVESMGYTETLFTALAAWSLFALLRRRWLTAGLLCLLAGLTRPTGAAIIAVVGLAALIAVIRRRDGWRPWLAAFLAPLGFLGYVAWVGDRLGRADGYFHVQNDAWRMGYDLGGYTVSTTSGLLTKSSPLALYMVVLVLLIAVTLLVAVATDRRVPWELTVYALLIVGLAFFGDSYFNSKARLLIPAFPLLLPVAAALASARRTVMVAVLTLLTLISASYGVYLGLTWTYSP